MEYRRILWICAVVLLLTLAWWRGTTHAQGGAEPVPPSMAVPEQDWVAEGEARSDPDSLTVSSLTTRLPTCYQPDPTRNECYINWDYLSVASAPATYMRAMTVTIGSRIRAVYRGFFQNSMYVANEMNGRGFKVACGAFGASGDPLMGLRYSYSVVALDSDNGRMGNYGSVMCPGVPLIYLPLVMKR